MEKKTPWMDVSNIWKKIAATIAAVGVLATTTVKVFKTPENLTYVCFAALGLVFLMISWYVDKQSLYTFKEMEMCKQDLIKDIEEHKKEYKDTVTSINTNMNELMSLSKDTRKDTLRIQLLMMIQTQPHNKDTILKIAETYFVKLDGDWYMTSEFTKWAKANEVEIPAAIWASINKHENR